MDGIKKRDVLASQLREHIPVDTTPQNSQQGLVSPRDNNDKK